MRKIYAIASLLALVSIALVARSFADDQKDSGVSVGAKAPDFSLQDQNGKMVSLHDSLGKIVVLEWTNPECPIVQRHYAAKTMQTLASHYQDKNVVWLAINSGNTATNETDKQWATEQNIAYPVLNDATGSTGHAYHATNTPEMYIIGTDGTLLYRAGSTMILKGRKPATRSTTSIRRWRKSCPARAFRCRNRSRMVAA